MTKEFFKKHGVAYTEYDVSTDTAKAQEMVEKSGQMGVPVIAIGSGEKPEVIVGFDQIRLSKALALKAA